MHATTKYYLKNLGIVSWLPRYDNSTVLRLSLLKNNTCVGFLILDDISWQEDIRFQALLSSLLASVNLSTANDASLVSKSSVQAYGTGVLLMIDSANFTLPALSQLLIDPSLKKEAWMALQSLYLPL